MDTAACLGSAHLLAQLHGVAGAAQPVDIRAQPGDLRLQPEDPRYEVLCSLQRAPAPASISCCRAWLSCTCISRRRACQGLVEATCLVSLGLW